MKNLFTAELLKTMHDSGVIAVITIDDAKLAVPLVRTLIDEGITVMELTLRTPCALDALAAVTSEIPGMSAGVGTVLQVSQLDEIIRLKAQFAVAPGCSTAVIDGALERKFPFAPGISTPSDIETALSRGCRLLKIFPAEPLGGIKYLKAANAPYSFLDLKYIPLGGVNAENMASWLEAPEILAVGGSWIAPPKLINNRDWTAIARNAREAVRISREVRG